MRICGNIMKDLKPRKGSKLHAFVCRFQQKCLPFGVVAFHAICGENKRRSEMLQKDRLFMETYAGHLVVNLVSLNYELLISQL